MPKRLPRARTLKGEPKLAHYDSGGGTAGEAPIVLLHGATLRSEDWENVFPRLATRYRVVAYDARGHGKSGRATEYGLRALIEDLGRILDVAAAPAIVIGHSVGGAAAYALQSNAPERFKALILEDPLLAQYGSWRLDYYRALSAILEKQGDPAALKAAVARLPLPAPGPKGERTVGEVRGFYSPERMAMYFADVDRRFADGFQKDKEGAKLLAGATLKVPTLLLTADPKQTALAEGEDEKLAASGDVTVVRFPGVSHRIHGTRPEPFLEALEPFLRKHRA